MRLLAALLLLSACDPCRDACEVECACTEGGEGCVDACLGALDAYESPGRDQVCAERQERFEEDCR